MFTTLIAAVIAASTAVAGASTPPVSTPHINESPAPYFDLGYPDDPNAGNTTPTPAE